MKKSFVITLLTAIMTLHFCSVSAAPNVVRGNSIGNIANYGEVAEDKDWIYYSYPGEGINKAKKDGSQVIRVCNEEADYINIVGDYIYCRLYDYQVDSNIFKNLGIYKIKKDGSSKTQISKDEAEYINIVGEWVYYANDSDYLKPYKMKIDGTNRKKMNDYPMSNLNVIGDWIYFENHVKGASLYKMKTDGTKMTKICDDSSYRLDINVIGEWIYYAPETPDHGLYKIKTDGSKRQKIEYGQISNINASGDWIYYVIFDDGIYKMKTDGTGRQKLIDDHASGICIANNWIYYMVFSYSSSGIERKGFYRVKTDGSVKESIFVTRKIVESPELNIMLNGNKEKFIDVPINVDNIPMLPLKELLIKMGVENDNKHIAWNDLNKSITVLKDKIKLVISQNSNLAYLNGSPLTLDYAPVTYTNGKTYISPTFINQVFDKSVVYDKVTNSIFIKDKNEYNKVKDILSKTDTAMIAQKKYKSSISSKVDASDDDNNIFSDYNFRVNSNVDRTNARAVISYFEGLESTEYKQRTYIADNTTYTNILKSDKWIKETVGQTTFDDLILLTDNIFKLNTDLLCSGLSIKENAALNEIELSGHTFLNELLTLLDYSQFLSGGGTPTFSMSVLIDKKTYLVKKIEINVYHAIDDVEYNSTVQITYDYNNTFNITIPNEVLNNVSDIGELSPLVSVTIADTTIAKLQNAIF